MDQEEYTWTRRVCREDVFDGELNALHGKADRQ